MAFADGVQIPVPLRRVFAVGARHKPRDAFSLKGAELGKNLPELTANTLNPPYYRFNTMRLLVPISSTFTNKPEWRAKVYVPGASVSKTDFQDLRLQALEHLASRCCL
jgi:hypothetical protein